MGRRVAKGHPLRKARQDRASARLATRIASNYSVEDERGRLMARQVAGYNVSKELAKLEARAAKSRPSRRIMA